MVGCFWRIAASISKHCAGVTPAAKARRAADGRPSASGSEKGSPVQGIGAAFDQRIDIFSDCSGPGSPRVTRDEGASAIFQLGKQRLSVPSDFPRAFRMSCTVKMSLSPRPERLTTSSCSFPVLAHHLQRGPERERTPAPDNPFVAGKRFKRVQRFVVGDRHIVSATGAVQNACCGPTDGKSSPAEME